MFLTIMDTEVDHGPSERWIPMVSEGRRSSIEVQEIILPPHFPKGGASGTFGGSESQCWKRALRCLVLPKSGGDGQTKCVQRAREEPRRAWQPFRVTFTRWRRL